MMLCSMYILVKYSNTILAITALSVCCNNWSASFEVLLNVKSNMYIFTHVLLLMSHSLSLVSLVLKIRDES